MNKPGSDRAIATVTKFRLRICKEKSHKFRRPDSSVGHGLA